MSQQRGEVAFTEQELDHLIEHHGAEMEALRLRRQALILEEHRIVLLFVSSSETQLQNLWLQIQQLVMFLSL